MRFIAQSLGGLLTRLALSAAHAAKPVEIADGLHGYDVVKNEGGETAFVRRIDFPLE
jgi:hypothetical protein